MNTEIEKSVIYFNLSIQYLHFRNILENITYFYIPSPHISIFLSVAVIFFLIYQHCAYAHFVSAKTSI